MRCFATRLVRLVTARVCIRPQTTQTRFEATIAPRSVAHDRPLRPQNPDRAACDNGHNGPAICPEVSDGAGSREQGAGRIMSRFVADQGAHSDRWLKANGKPERKERKSTIRRIREGQLKGRLIANSCISLVKDHPAITTDGGKHLTRPPRRIRLDAASGLLICTVVVVEDRLAKFNQYFWPPRNEHAAIADKDGFPGVPATMLRKSCGQGGCPPLSRCPPLSS